MFRASQIITIMNCVVVSSVGIKRFDCIAYISFPQTIFYLLVKLMTYTIIFPTQPSHLKCFRGNGTLQTDIMTEPSIQSSD